MCTVTFVGSGSRFFITHNRDEMNDRPKALPPAKYVINGASLVFPKDRKAGGTWIGMNENGNAAALLNGAFFRHQPKPPYRKSRGLVFFDICATADMMAAWHATDLTGIEPFTLIVFSNDLLFECRWDGLRKHALQLDTGKHHIWSSSTLYNARATAERESWFEHWLLESPSPDQKDIIDFHLTGGNGDPANNLRMSREGNMQTQSITAMELTPLAGHMRYFDLHDQQVYKQDLAFNKVPAAVQ